MSFLNTISDGIFDIFFPRHCAGCQKSGPYLCPDCLSAAPEAERESEEWIFPVFDYRYPPVRSALWLFKYKGKKKLAGIFAGVLYGKMIEALSELSLMENFNDAVMIPIPLSRKRRRERGYNQAELIGEALVKIDKNINFKLEKNILIKPGETGHQARTRSRTERLKNIAGSFAVPDKKKVLVKNKNVILIDDILTTGATLNEARKTLVRAGARKIIAFTVAH